MRQRHRKDHEVHHAAKFSSCLIPDENEHAERTEHKARQDQAGSTVNSRPAAEKYPEPRDQQEDRPGAEKPRFRQQLADNRYHRGSGLTSNVRILPSRVINHRERRLHAVEELDHRHQAGAM